ncbi:scavenger receptor cysteine-rich domain-containing protein DMBT1-like [Rhinoraja longicauda]
MAGPQPFAVGERALSGLDTWSQMFSSNSPGDCQAGISGSVKLRLVNGGSRCAGRLEIHYRSQWGTVDDDNWDLPDAAVVCRELGCGAALAAPGWAHFGEGSGPLVTGNVRCSGSERALRECRAETWDHYNGSHSYDAGVICAVAVIRSGRISGRRKKDNALMNNISSELMKVFWRMKKQSTADLFSTPVSVEHNALQNVAASPITGSVKLRLVNGGSRCAGRLEIHYRNQWGTVDDDNWDLPDAAVVCRELGCGAALAAPGNAHFGEGSGPIVTWGVGCSGSERALRECNASSWDHYTGSHSYDAGVICAVAVIRSGRISGRRKKDNALMNNISSELMKVFWRMKKQSTADFFFQRCHITPLNYVLRQLVPHTYQPAPVSVEHNALQNVAASPITGSVKLRLVNGGSRCAGRLEIHYRNQWGTVDDDNWDLPDAAVVCRELGCGAALAAPGNAHFGEGSGPIVTWGVGCSGSERALRECNASSWDHYNGSHSYDAGVICAGPRKPRLVGGSSPCGGRLELFTGGTWSTLCGDISWSIPIGDRVCQELSCGPVSVEHNALQNVAASPITGSVKLRLVNGGSRCAGRLEIHYRSQWGTVDDDNWDLPDAAVVCRELGCGAALAAPGRAHFGEGSGPIVTWNVHCSGSERALRECRAASWRHYNAPHSYDAGVICAVSPSAEFLGRLPVPRFDEPSGRAPREEAAPSPPFPSKDYRNLRLVSGDGRCSGRIEIQQGSAWGTLCDDHFDLEDAAVVCEYLQCGVVTAIHRGAHLGKGSGQIWKQKYMCRGNETRLWDCPISSGQQFRCSHENDVGVTCSDESWTPRLTNGGSRCDGTVEIYHNRRWGRVQDIRWDLHDANVVCNELDCGEALSAYNSSQYGESHLPLFVSGVDCKGNVSQLRKCNLMTPPSFANDSGGVGVLCSGHKMLRLADGGSPCAGRVEVYYAGVWGSVCDDSWDLADADVVCRQQGCGNALKTKRSADCGQGSGPIWLDEVTCTGDESFLWDCPSASWGEHDCAHKEDVMVMCSEHREIRLVNGGRDCAGRVEVFYNGSWGTVCSERVTTMDAVLICKQLRCGPLQGIRYSIEQFGAGSGSIWFNGMACTSHESTLWQCAANPRDGHDCRHTRDTGVICSDAKVPERPKDCFRESGTVHARSPERGLELRLVGAESRCSGRVEIFTNNSWATVCDDSWGEADAHVVCRQLRCGPAVSAAAGAAFGQGDGVIWLDEVKCTGSESFLSDCGSSPPGQNDCSHKEDAGVICSDPQLSPRDSSSSRSGRKMFTIPVIACVVLGFLFVCGFVALFLVTRIKQGRRESVHDSDDDIKPVGVDERGDNVSTFSESASRDLSKLAGDPFARGRPLGLQPVGAVDVNIVKLAVPG